MASKAIKAQDATTYNEIMAIDDPVLIKRMGKRVQGITQQQWHDVAPPIIKIGLEAKFSQCQEARKELLNSANLTLAESSPTDAFWGIFLGITSPLLQQKPWPGQNQMGKLLMEVRSQIRANPRPGDRIPDFTAMDTNAQDFLNSSARSDTLLVVSEHDSDNPHQTQARW